MPIGQIRIESKEITFNTHKELLILDLTGELEKFVKDIGISEGRVTVFSIGSTCSIVFSENEQGLFEDIQRFLKELVIKDDNWKHDIIDNNAHSHLRSMILGSDVTIPIIDGKLITGTWQQVIFIELGLVPRSRRVVFQIVGLN